MMNCNTQSGLSSPEEPRMLNLPSLSDSERKHLHGVLQRAEEVQRQEEWRKVKLRTASNINIVSKSFSQNQEKERNPSKCSACGSNLLWLINPAKSCDRCQESTCKNCTQLFDGGYRQFCSFCFLDLKYRLESGEWFITKRHKANRTQKFAIEELRDALSPSKGAYQKRAGGKSPNVSPMPKRAGDDRRRTVPSIIVDECEKQTAVTLPHKKTNIHRKMLERDFHDARSDYSDDSSYLGSSASVSMLSSTSSDERRLGHASSLSDPTSEYAIAKCSLSIVYEEKEEDCLSELAILDYEQGFSDVTEAPDSNIHDSTTIDDVPDSSTKAHEIDDDPSKIYMNQTENLHSAGDRDTTAKNEVGLLPSVAQEPIYKELTLTLPRKRSMASQESLFSLYSLADENFELPAEMATGDVQLSLEYDYRKGNLLVIVRQCRNILPYTKTKKSSDPYVKMYLLPDKTRLAKRKTSTKKATLNPVYNENFKYRVESGDIHTRVLWVTVWHCIRLGHNVFLGEVHIPLSDINLSDPAPQWFSLHEKREIDLPSTNLIYKGDLNISVKHTPTHDILIVNERQVDSRGELHVWIKDAKNLIPVHSDGYSNPFAKVVLLPDKSKKGKRKTDVIRKTLCPSWNTVLRFENIAAAELPRRSLEITVWSRSRLRGNEFLGGVRLNLGKGKYEGEEAKWMNASGYEVTLWRSVIQRSNTWVEGCLSLRANMD